MSYPLLFYVYLLLHNGSFLPHGVSFRFYGVNPRDEEMGVGIGLGSGDGKIREMGEGVIEFREVIEDQNV